MGELTSDMPFSRLFVEAQSREQYAIGWKEARVRILSSFGSTEKAL